MCGISGELVESGGEDGGELLALVSAETGEARVYSKAVCFDFVFSDVECPLMLIRIQQALLLQASTRPDEDVVDPVTGETFDWDELKKVYVI